MGFRPKGRRWKQGERTRGRGRRCGSGARWAWVRSRGGTPCHDFLDALRHNEGQDEGSLRSGSGTTAIRSGPGIGDGGREAAPGKYRTESLHRWTESGEREAPDSAFLDSCSGGNNHSGLSVSINS